MTLANTVKKALKEAGIDVVSCRYNSQWVNDISYDVVIKNKADFSNAYKIASKAISAFNKKDVNYCAGVLVAGINRGC